MNICKNYVYALILIVSSSLLLFLVILTVIERREQPKKFKIVDTEIINIDTISNFIDISKISQQHPEELTLLEIKKIFLENPYIKDCELSVDYENKLVINLHHRNIIYKATNIYGETFLIDDNDIKIPIQRKLNLDNIVTISGVKEKYTYLKKITDAKVLQITSLIKLIKLNRTFQYKVLKANVGLNNDTYLIIYNPTDKKNYNFIIGDNLHLEKKIRNIRIFFQEIMPKFKSKNYSSINLKYDNQIICYK